MEIDEKYINVCKKYLEIEAARKEYRQHKQQKIGKLRSYKLSATALCNINELAKEMKISKTEVIERAVRFLTYKEK